MSQIIWEVIEGYNGVVSTLYTTDDEADALKIRDWHREQWSDYDAARKCVVVRRKTK